MSYSRNYICKFMQVNSWHHKLFHFHLSFWIWKVWKGKKSQKFEYLKTEKSLSFGDKIKIWQKTADTSFKRKLSVTTVNNSFCHKELHPRFCIGLELNIVTTSAKILIGIGGGAPGTPPPPPGRGTGHPPTPPHDWVHYWVIWKTHSPRCPKTYF